MGDLPTLGSLPGSFRWVAAMQIARNNEQADAAVNQYKPSHVNPDQGGTSRFINGTTNYNGQPCLQLDDSGTCSPISENGVGTVFGKLLSKAGIVASGARIGTQGTKGYQYSRVTSGVFDSDLIGGLGRGPLLSGVERGGVPLFHGHR